MPRNGGCARDDGDRGKCQELPSGRKTSSTEAATEAALTMCTTEGYILLKHRA